MLVVVWDYVCVVNLPPGKILQHDGQERYKGRLVFHQLADLNATSLSREETRGKGAER